MNYRKRIQNTAAAALLVCAVTVTPVYAEPADTAGDLQNEQADLQSQKSAAQSELSSLQSQLEQLLSKAAELEDQLIAKGEEITQAEDDLVVAEEKRQDQYDAMKLRIKYIYESGGDAATIEKVLSSGDISTILTQAEYSQKVHEYDREQLQAYVQTVQEISELHEKLEEEMANLESLEGQYQEQQETLDATITSKQDEISNLDGMIQEAAQRVLEQRQREQEEQREAEEAAQEETDNRQTQEQDRDAGGNDADDADDATGGNEDNASEPETETPSAPEPDYSASAGNAIVSRAWSMIGKPYKWSAVGPDSFDCSGLVSYCVTGEFKRAYTTYSLMAMPHVSNPQPGDICTTYTHCGIYIGGGQMIHAPQTGDVVKVSPVKSGMVYVRP